MRYKRLLIIGLFLGFFLWGLSDISKPLAISIFTSYVLNKPLSYLEKNACISRSFSAILFITLIILALLGMLTFILPFLNQNIILITQKMPEFFNYINNQWGPSLNQLIEKFDITNSQMVYQRIQTQLLDMGWYTAKYMLNWVQEISITNIVYYFVIMPFLIYYMSIDWARITRLVHDFIPSKRFSATMEDLDRVFFLYFKGQSLLSMILIVLYSFALSLAGIKNPLIVGLIVGLLSFIPYIGTIFGFVLIMLVTLAHTSHWAMILWVCVIFGGLNIIENQILAPKLIGKRLGLPPLILILAIVVANYYFGLLGMFVAYPVTAVSVKLIQELWQKPAQPKTV